MNQRRSWFQENIANLSLSALLTNGHVRENYLSILKFVVKAKANATYAWRCIIARFSYTASQVGSTFSAKSRYCKALAVSFFHVNIIALKY